MRLVMTAFPLNRSRLRNVLLMSVRAPTVDTPHSRKITNKEVFP